MRTILYGYKMVGGLFTVVESEADIVKRIFSDYTEGISFLKISDALNVERIPYEEENRGWNKNIVRRIILNDVYKGNANYPKIISDELFDLARKKADEKSTPHTETTPEVSIIKKLTICGQCGSPISRVAKWTKKREKWLCPHGCKINAYISDQTLHLALNIAVSRVLNWDMKLTESKGYMPSIEVKRCHSEIDRILDAKDCNFQSVREQILYAASIRFAQCEQNDIERIVEMSRTYAKQTVHTDADNVDFIRRLTDRICIEASGSICFELINGEKLTVLGEENEQ